MAEIIKYRDHQTGEFAVCKCECGAEVELHDSWSNDCHKCGREYNMSGQELAPRNQWGEETGEKFS